MIKKNKLRVHDIFYEIALVKSTLKKLESKRNKMILKDLNEKNLLDKYSFSYRDLAKKYGVSSSTIQKIAEIHNLSRKKDLD